MKEKYLKDLRKYYKNFRIIDRKMIKNLIKNFKKQTQMKISELQAQMLSL